jgi:OOP family OmpA-OmpF porin
MATSAAGLTVELPPPPPLSKAAERFCNKPSVIVVEFETGKATVKATGKYEADVKIVGEFLNEFPKARGEISGHTDNVGGKAYNDSLSLARADFIKNYLVEKSGISADRITTKGYGFSRPVATNRTKAGRQQNRLIEANFTCE